MIAPSKRRAARAARARRNRGAVAALALLAAVAGALAGCERATAPAPPAGEGAAASAASQAAPADLAVEAARARAEGAAKRLMGALMAELGKALAAGPPEDAVRVCAEVAQAISKEVAAKEDLDLRRTALRLRNPLNAPDAYERAALERWASGEVAVAPRAEVVVGASGGRELRYLHPIVLPAMCTTCHGPAESIAPAVREAIARSYPADQATGFREGDLRGAVSVRVPLDAAGAGDGLTPPRSGS